MRDIVTSRYATARHGILFIPMPPVTFLRPAAASARYEKLMAV